MAIIPDGYGQLVFNFSHPAASGALTVTLGVQLSGGMTETQLEAIGNAWQTNVMAQVNSLVEFDSMTCYVGTGTPGEPIIVEAVAEWGGGALGATAMPINTSYLIRKTTGLGGRRNRGRMYLPGPQASDMEDAGTLSPSRVTALQVGFNNFFDDLTETATTGVLVPVILHSSGAGAPTPVGSFIVDNLPATQRTRMRD